MIGGFFLTPDIRNLNPFPLCVAEPRVDFVFGKNLDP
jgi:hypothetical protein